MGRSARKLRAAGLVAPIRVIEARAVRRSGGARRRQPGARHPKSPCYFELRAASSSAGSGVELRARVVAAFA